MASDLLPGSIRDGNNQAFAQLVERLGGLDLSQVVVNWVDNVDSSALPHLMEQFHVTGVEGGDFATTAADQRELIKQSILMHRSKGTLAAVKAVLTRLDVAGQISEWMEYGGEPYTFRVLLNSENGISQDLLNNLTASIEEYKSFRSKLEILTLSVATAGDTPRFACALTSGEIITINPQE